MPRPQTGFPEIPVKRETVNFFLSQKEKSLQKRSWQPCRLIACAHQLSRKNIFCFRGYCASDGGFTYTRSKEVGICRFTKWRFRFDGRGACPSSSREPRNTNRMGLRSTIRGGDFDQMDAGVPPQNLIAPTWGFVPSACRRINLRPQTEPSSNLYYRRLLPPLCGPPPSRREAYCRPHGGQKFPSGGDRVPSAHPCIHLIVIPTNRGTQTYTVCVPWFA